MSGWGNPLMESASLTLANHHEPDAHRHPSGAGPLVLILSLQANFKDVLTEEMDWPERIP